MAKQEENQIDIWFQYGGKRAVTELKTCFGISTRHAIREAIGQLFEYNHYPNRTVGQIWLIVLDAQPTHNDRKYIDALRMTFGLSLFLGWKYGEGDNFTFHPTWPQ